jgi:signal transduction histidine kinase
MRLFPKLLLSFLAVAFVGVLVVALAANQATAREVRGLMMQGDASTDYGLAQQLAGYYRGHGSWDNVHTLLSDGHMIGGMMGSMMGQSVVIVADASGQIVADTGSGRLGAAATSAELTEGIPITVDNHRVGTLIAESGSGAAVGRYGPGDNLLTRVNIAIGLGALAAGGAALVVGGLFAYGIVRPVRQLTEATAAVARGALDHRVPVNSRDEIGQLGAAFNSMAADLQNAERLRRDMTADVAHELRNPIAVLRGNIEAVIDGVLPPTPDNLQPLLEQTQLLSRLVDDLRMLALADADELSLDRQPTDVGALAQTMLAQFSAAAEARRITLTPDVAPALPGVWADPQRLSQVIGNLLSNAIRHTPEGGTIRLGVAAKAAGKNAGEVALTVADSGPGITPEALPHVFERFYRADRSRSRADGGTGLGLAIARKLVELHGGRIGVSSEPGQGASFTVWLPAGGTAAPPV